MRELYKQNLSQLGEELEHMSHNVTRAIERSTRALREGDVSLAEQTIDADERLDEAARRIDESCVSLLARQAPVARDLRLILAALRLSQTMERQGDLARHLAVIARSSFPQHSISEAVEPILGKMCDAAVAQARRTEELVDTQNLELAVTIQDEDDELDDLLVQLKREVADESVQLSRQQVVDTTLAGRFLERFGDHSVSIARRVAFIVEGFDTNPDDGIEGTL